MIKIYIIIDKCVDVVDIYMNNNIPNLKSKWQVNHEE